MQSNVNVIEIYGAGGIMPRGYYMGYEISTNRNSWLVRLGVHCVCWHAWRAGRELTAPTLASLMQAIREAQA